DLLFGATGQSLLGGLDQALARRTNRANQDYFELGKLNNQRAPGASSVVNLSQQASLSLVTDSLAKILQTAEPPLSNEKKARLHEINREIFTHESRLQQAFLPQEAGVLQSLQQQLDIQFSARSEITERGFQSIQQIRVDINIAYQQVEQRLPQTEISRIDNLLNELGEILSELQKTLDQQQEDELERLDEQIDKILLNALSARDQRKLESYFEELETLEQKAEKSRLSAAEEKRLEELEERIDILFEKAERSLNPIDRLQLNFLALAREAVYLQPSLSAQQRTSVQQLNVQFEQLSIVSAEI
ncbi:MAG: hypothetical protein AAF352_02400, partial [Pseudomonadota bacterium]